MLEQTGSTEEERRQSTAFPHNVKVSKFNKYLNLQRWKPTYLDFYRRLCVSFSVSQTLDGIMEIRGCIASCYDLCFHPAAPLLLSVYSLLSCTCSNASRYMTEKSEFSGRKVLF